MRNKISVLGIEVASLTMEEAVDRCENYIVQGGPHLVATANAEMIMMAQQDKELASILTSADLVVPDGAGVVWAARRQGCSMPERVAGFDLTQRLLALSAEKGYKVYLFGGAPGIADQARITAEKKYPGLKIIGVRDGYFMETEDKIIADEIHHAQPDILLAALGVPKQEKWLAKYKNILNVPLAMGVGGTFDVMAGTVTRAPLWMQRANLEWFYRLLSQPSRALRMLALPRFALRVLLGKSIRQK